MKSDLHGRAEDHVNGNGMQLSSMPVVPMESANGLMSSHLTQVPQEVQVLLRFERMVGVHAPSWFSQIASNILAADAA